MVSKVYRRFYNNISYYYKYIEDKYLNKILIYLEEDKDIKEIQNMLIYGKNESMIRIYILRIVNSLLNDRVNYKIKWNDCIRHNISSDNKRVNNINVYSYFTEIEISNNYSKESIYYKDILCYLKLE
jgi:hypothetical protein